MFKVNFPRLFASVHALIAGRQMTSLKGTSMIQEWRKEIDRIAFKPAESCYGFCEAPVIKIESDTVCLPITERALSNLYSVQEPKKLLSEIIHDPARFGLNLDKSLITFCNPEAWKLKLEAIAEELRESYQRKDITFEFEKAVLNNDSMYLAPVSKFGQKSHIATLLILLPVEGHPHDEVLRYQGGGGKKTDAFWYSLELEEGMLKSMGNDKRLILEYKVFSKDEVNKDESKYDTSRLISIVDAALAQKDNALILLDGKYDFAKQIHWAYFPVARHLKGRDRGLYSLLFERYGKNETYSMSVIEIDIKVEKHQMPDGEWKDLVMIEPTSAYGIRRKRRYEPLFAHFTAADKDNACPCTLVADDPLRLDTNAKEGEADDSSSSGGGDTNAAKRRAWSREISYFSSPKVAYLFNTDDVRARHEWDLKDAEQCGVFAIPETKRTRFCAISIVIPC